MNAATKRPGVLELLRAIRLGRPVDHMGADKKVVLDALSGGLIEPTNQRLPTKRWRFKLTPEGLRQAGPVLRLLPGGKS